MEWKKPFDEIDLIPHTDQRGTLFEVIRFKDFSIPEGGQIYTVTDKMPAGWRLAGRQEGEPRGC